MDEEFFSATVLVPLTSYPQLLQVLSTIKIPCLEKKEISGPVAELIPIRPLKMTNDFVRDQARHDGDKALGVTGFFAGNYCSASIKRVMVRFSSLSERRISSILLMEWSTVV